MRLPAELEHVHVFHISQLRKAYFRSISYHHNSTNAHPYLKYGKGFVQIASFEDETYFKGGML